MLQSWKRSSRQRRIALAARWTQVVSSFVTCIILVIAVRYYLWDADPLYICSALYTTTTNIVFGCLGLVVLRWPEKIHWHVMAALDLLAFAAMLGAVVCIVSSAVAFWWYGTSPALWGIGIFTACIALLANITVLVQTARAHVQLTLVNRKESRSSPPLQPKSLKDDELWPADLRAYDLEEQYVRPQQAPPSEADHASVSQDIADQITYPAESESGSHSQRQMEPGDKITTPTRSLSEICHWSITSGTLTGGASSVRSAVPSFEK